MRLGDTIAIFCQRCHRVTDSQAKVCDVDLGGQLVIDNILCTVCGRCGKITSLAARDAVRVDNRPRLTDDERKGMDEVLTMLKPPQPEPPATPPSTFLREAQTPLRRQLGQIFYGGLALGTVLAGIAFSWPEYALPSFLSFAVATGLYSTLQRGG